MDKCGPWLRWGVRNLLRLLRVVGMDGACARIAKWQVDRARNQVAAVVLAQKILDVIKESGADRSVVMQAWAIAGHVSMTNKEHP